MAAQASGNLFGRAWVAEIVAQGLLGVSRFNQFHKELGVSRRILAQRLAELVDEGLMVREKYQARPDRYEYHLTRKGCDLRPVLIAMTRWSEAWRADTPDPASETTPDRQGSEGL
jgi:DNA-binding HxlR family transcriptional regulator